jgi:hypothetical protein
LRGNIPLIRKYEREFVRFYGTEIFYPSPEGGLKKHNNKISSKEIMKVHRHNEDMSRGKYVEQENEGVL